MPVYENNDTKKKQKSADDRGWYEILFEGEYNDYKDGDEKMSCCTFPSLPAPKEAKNTRTIFFLVVEKQELMQPNFDPQNTRDLIHLRLN